MCFEYWEQYRFEDCGHIETYRGSTELCASAAASGMECSKKTTAMQDLVDAVRKCSDCITKR